MVKVSNWFLEPFSHVAWPFAWPFRLSEYRTIFSVFRWDLNFEKKLLSFVQYSDESRFWVVWYLNPHWTTVTVLVCLTLQRSFFILLKWCLKSPPLRLTSSFCFAIFFTRQGKHFSICLHITVAIWITNIWITNFYLFAIQIPGIVCIIHRYCRYSIGISNNT